MTRVQIKDWIKKQRGNLDFDVSVAEYDEIRNEIERLQDLSEFLLTKLEKAVEALETASRKPHGNVDELIESLYDRIIVVNNARIDIEEMTE